MTRYKYGVPENFEYAFARALEDLPEIEEYGEIDSVDTFSDIGLLTMNAGVRITLDTGLELQLTINHSGGQFPEDVEEEEEEEEEEE